MKTKIMIATQNKGKQKEFAQLLSELDVELVFPPDDMDVEETGETLEENAWLKAKAYAEKFDTIAVADDSGLLVDALDGRPGVYSKRYGATDEERNTKLLLEMEGKEERDAHFACVICVAGQGWEGCFEGKVYGSIAQTAQGTHGFGYDPIFIPEGYQDTFAELGVEEKNKISHRAIALQQFREFVEERLKKQPR